MAHNSISFFTVLQWNIRSIRSNYNNLQILIKDFDPDVIALTETYLKFENTFTMPGYEIIREERADRYGGLAIVIKSHIHTEAKSVNSSLLPDRCQTLGVTIDTNLSIILSYFPPDVYVPGLAWDTFLPYMNGRVIWLGDFNTQHPAWGSGTPNPRGVTFNEFLLYNDLVLLNMPTPTRLTSPYQHRSAPDVSVATPNVARK